MSTYELDDDLVRQWLDDYTQDSDVPLAQALNKQLPIPVPTKLGAVVRTDEGVFVRRIGNDNRDRVWWLVPDGPWFENHQVGRITEMLSEGVDL